MGKDNQMREWIAHVGLENGISEVIVWGANRWDASDAVYRKLYLDGAADPRIKSFRMEHYVKNTTDPHDVVPDVPKRDKSKDKRFRVRVYLSPRSGDVKQYNLRTDTAESALWSVMQMFKVKAESDLGPYCVEESRNNEYVTVKWNQLHTFPIRGPVVGKSTDAYDPAPRQTLPSVGYNEELMSLEAMDEEWAQNWPGMGDSYYDRMRDHTTSPPPVPRSTTFLKEMESIFKDETLAPKPTIKVVTTR